jgi:DNA-binding CsgD family transcriptional regulator
MTCQPPGEQFGRANELARLHVLLDDAMTGRLRVVRCSGKPGIGKTALLDRFADEAATRGVRVLRARSFGSAGAPPYSLWRQVLRTPNSLDGLDSLADPAALAERIADRLRQAAADRGFVLLIDDLHQADGPSLATLVDVMRLLQHRRVLVCLAHDDARDKSSPWDGVRLDVLGEPDVEVVNLSGLSRDESFLRLSAVAGWSLPESLADEVFETTRGNPLFLGELGRYLGAWPPEDPPPALPRSLDDLVSQRLRELSAPARRLLEAAAIQGDTVRTAVLARVLESGQTELPDAIDEAASAGFLCVYAPGGRLEFDSSVVRASILAGLPLSERVSLHRRTALAIEDLAAGSVANHLGELTFHWSAAASVGASAEASSWARRAADEAMRVLAFGEAERLYRLALEYAEGLTGIERADLLLALAAAAFRRGHLPAARRSCIEALDIARQLESAELLASAALTLEPCGNLTWDGDIHRWCSEALALSTHDDATRARLLARLAQAAAYCGYYDEADVASAQALSLADEAGDLDLTIGVLSSRQLARSGPDHVVEVASLAARMIAAGTAWRRPEAEMWGRLWLIDTYRYAGQLAEIAAELPRLQRTTERVGGPYARWHLLVTRAALALARAEFDDADRLVRDAVDHFERLGHPAARGASVSFRLLIGHHRGQPEEMLSPVTWDFGADSHWDLGRRLFRAFALVDAQRLDEAAAVYQRCGVPEGWEVAPMMRLVELAVGAQVAAALGLADDTQELRERLTPYRGQYIVGGAGGTNFLGPVELTLGKCAAALADWDSARVELTAASSLCRQIGAPGFQVEADCELATALAQAGDRAAATRLAERTLPLSSALGMTLWTRRLATMTEQGDPLTPRESEIAALVAQGLSNRGIAEALVISERTAQNHVQHILGKLGYANRAQIAAWATRQRSR